MRDSEDAAGCLACGAALTDGPGHGWLRCTGCRSWRRERLPTPEELDAAHERLYFGAQQRCDMTASRLLEQYVHGLDARVALAGRTVLDVGAGTATTPELLAGLGADYRAVEASPTARTELARRGWTAYPNPTAARQHEPDLDVALLVEVVEHLLDPVHVLRAVGDCLRPGGHLYLTTPNASSLHGRLRGGRWWAAALEAHVALYTVAGLDALFAASGLQRVGRHRRVDYGHGRLHGLAQSLLQVVGADGGLRVLAVRQGTRGEQERG